MEKSSLAPYADLFNALCQIPILHYLLAFLVIYFTFLYNFLEFHLFQDLLGGGTPVGLSYHPSSKLYEAVVSKCEILHSRYRATPWISSPHLQILFLRVLGKAPDFTYKRQLYPTCDGGTIALDWLLSSDVHGGGPFKYDQIPKDDKTPIVILIPGLSSHSSSNYIQNYAFKMAQRGWNVVVSNHRGMGGVPLTSDVFYHGGRTEDLRDLVNHLHQEYPKAPLFIVGTSLGANIMVKYLGEEGDRTPVAGAVAVCNPFDLLISDRSINRGIVQNTFYNRALAIGLQRFARLHKDRYSRLGNWEGITEARRLRDFDTHGSCRVSNFETTDTYYRKASSAPYVGNVSVPLLCINVLDDPVCTKEAIAWDECRANPNIVLATTEHGGHLAFFEGLRAESMWWIRAADEFLDVLHSSPLMRAQKKQALGQHSLVDSAINHGHYVNGIENGMLAAETDRGTEASMVEETKWSSEIPSNAEPQEQRTEAKFDAVNSISQTFTQFTEQDNKSPKVAAVVGRCLNQISPIIFEESY